MDNKMKYQGRLMISGICSIIIAICIFGLNYKYMLNGKAPSINTMLRDNHFDLASEKIMDEKFCTLTIDSSLGAFAEASNKREGSSGVTYYIAYLEDNSVMMVKVYNKADIEKLDMITEETGASNNNIAEHTLTVEGKVSWIQSGEVKDLYDNALKEMGIKDAKDNKIKIRDICIDATDNSKHLWILFGVFLGVGVLVLFGDAIALTIEQIIKRKSGF